MIFFYIQFWMWALIEVEVWTCFHLLIYYPRSFHKMLLSFQHNLFPHFACAYTRTHTYTLSLFLLSLSHARQGSVGTISFFRVEFVDTESARCGRVSRSKKLKRSNLAISSFKKCQIFKNEKAKFSKKKIKFKNFINIISFVLICLKQALNRP